jgi:hypothetical protein
MRRVTNATRSGNDIRVMSFAVPCLACLLVLSTGCVLETSLGSSDTQAIAGSTGSTGTTSTSTDAEASTTGEGTTSSSSSSNDDDVFATSSFFDILPSTGSTGVQGCQGIDARTIVDFCGVFATQATAVTATTEAGSFTGVIAFYGLMHCADCAAADDVNVYVFAELPPGDASFDPPDVAMLRATFDTDLATQEVQVLYHDPALEVSEAVDAATVTILDAPTNADFDAPLSERDPPRLRVELEGSGETFQVSGLVDAVYCDRANYYVPCE